MDFLSLTKEQRELVISHYNNNITPKNKNECWEWEGPRFSGGYGRFRVYNAKLGLDIYANSHRVAWMIKYNANVPKELICCHTCDNPPCSNPHHIKIADQKENQLDAVIRGRWRMGTIKQRPIEERVQIMREYINGASSASLGRKYNMDGAVIRKWSKKPEMIQRFGKIDMSHRYKKKGKSCQMTLPVDKNT